MGQCLLITHVIGHIGVGTDNAARATQLIPFDQHASIQYPDIMTFFMAQTVNTLKCLGFTIEVSLQRRQHSFFVIGMQSAFPSRVKSFKLMGTVTYHLFPTIRQKNFTAGDVPVPDPISSPFHRKQPALFIVPQLLQGALQLLVILMQVILQYPYFTENPRTIDFKGATLTFSGLPNQIPQRANQHKVQHQHKAQNEQSAQAPNPHKTRIESICHLSHYWRQIIFQIDKFYIIAVTNTHLGIHWIVSLY